MLGSYFLNSPPAPAGPTRPSPMGLPQEPNVHSLRAQVAKTNHLFVNLFFVALLLTAAGCQGRGSADEGGADGDAAGDSTAVDGTGDDSEEEEEAVPVQVVELGTGPMEAVIQSSANLEAERSIEVFAEASRRIVELLVEEGDVVKKGQLLARLQDDEQRSMLGQARARLDKAQREYEHQQSLHERGLTTEKALNDARADFDQQRLAAEDAERQLGYTRIIAPIAGTVTQRLVKIGDNVTVGQHVFDIVDFESLVALVYVPEKNLSMLKAKQPARIIARAVRKEPFTALVDRVSPIVDARSGTIKVTVDVGGQPGLRPGLFVEVQLVTAVHQDAILIPKRALVYDNDQVYLYRVKDDETVERVLVQPMLSNAIYVEPAGGFSPGDEVVMAGQAGLKNGAKIEVVQPGTPAVAKSDEAAESSR